MRPLAFVAAAVLVACCCCGKAWSAGSAAEDAYSATVVASPVGPPGLNTWTYTLTNTSLDASYNIAIFQLEVDPDTSIVKNEVIDPPLWVSDRDDPHCIQWACTSETNLPAGGVRDGFAITFSQQPAYQNYTAVFDDGGMNYGVVSVAAPEPGSAVALLAGVVSLAACIRRRRS